MKATTNTLVTVNKRRRSPRSKQKDLRDSSFISPFIGKGNAHISSKEVGDFVFLN
jgi:hypothetical protein